MRSVTVLYNISDQFPMAYTDQIIRRIAKKFEARELGSGTFLPTRERDVEFDVPTDQVEGFIEAIKKENLRVTR